MKRICVFCGASAGTDGAFARAAGELGGLLARRGLGLVYGGGRVGLMGTLADAVLEAGGDVLGVIPRGLKRREVAHAGLSTLHVVESMHERKQVMFDHADAFIALPGGFGTLDEFCEVLTWRQLGHHRKPMGLLDVSGYFGHFLAFLDHAVASRLIRPEHRALILVEREPDALLERLLSPGTGADPGQRREHG